MLDSTQTRYEFRIDDEKVYRIDRVIIRTDDNSRRIYTAGTASEVNQEYTEDLEFNTITLHADTVSTYNGRRVEIDYVPTYIHQLTRNKAALWLVDKSGVTNVDADTPTTGLRILQRIGRIEKAVKVAIAVGSQDVYDPTFGEVIPQRRFRTY